jgi:hypothetical protein
VALAQVKKFKMDRHSIKDLMYGALGELMHNRKYYYHSTVGVNYSHWTDEGKEALYEFMNIIAFKMLEAEEAELNQRAKDLVVKGLKGDKI